MIDTIRLKTEIHTFNRKNCKMYDHFDHGDLVYEVFKIDMKLGSFYPNIGIFISRNLYTFSKVSKIYSNFV